MKKILSLLIFLPFFYFASGQGTVGNSLFELKVTPTSILNLGKPNLLVGVEVYVSRKIGLQIEYGLPLSKKHLDFSSLIAANRPKENRLYHRIKGEFKYYTYFQRGFADFFSLGFLHTPQTYTVNSGFVILPDGRILSTVTPRMEAVETALFSNYGGKIWFTKRLFMEYYMGGGIKFINNKLINFQAPPPTSSPGTFSAPQTSLFDFSNKRNKQGEWISLFIDFGIKFGYSF